MLGAYPGLIAKGGTAHAAPEDFAGGVGTSEDPFRIASAEQLGGIKNHLTSHFVLVNDINMYGYSGWVPIGDTSLPFTGKLDGQNFEISNFMFDRRTMDAPAGFFGVIGTNGHIRNLNFKDVLVVALDETGILAGRAVGAVIDRVGIAGNVTGEDMVGGLVGSLSGGSIVTNSYASGMVTSRGQTSPGVGAGGLIGSSSASSIIDSHASSHVEGKREVGGLVGTNKDNGTITNSHASGDVIGQNDVGGLAGISHNGADISGSSATGNVTGLSDVGGLIGELENAELSISYAVGNVAGCNDVGGLIGDNDARIINSYATGNVTGLSDEASCGNYSDSIGGLVGDNKDGTIENTFAIGRVTGSAYIGGLTGINDNGGIIHSYYDMETSGLSDTNGEGLTSEEMKDRLNYTGFDFATVWGIDAPHHSGYPYLSAIQTFVTYAGNGTDHGSEQYRSHSYSNGSQVKILERSNDWTKSGFLFQSWNTAADGSGDTYRVQDTVTLIDNMVLYAVWKRPDVPYVPQLSDNANLSRLTVKSGEEELALTPTFAANTTNYQTETTANEVTIEAIPFDANASVAINKANLVGGKTIALLEGINEFEIAVRAESGTVKTYKLSIQRLPEIDELPPEVPACTFRDIKGHWAESHICEALQIGIVEGPSETTFQPQKYITRVEFAAMLLRTLEIDSAPAGSELTFIDRDQIPAWATDLISTAQENGILQGYPDQTLRPMQRVSRSEMVVMMARALKWDLEAGYTSFADDADIPAWAKGYVLGAVERELVTGRDGNRFSSMQPATRAEATTLLLRLWHDLATDAN
ncbi:hypothetical protein PAT3040_01603 [Paenibacillus agaridevorans]|uniref:SLH domain-containing protein n=2 Tax=Paenibacillus agaridevorans TaxID=171404 RepID=A0A2R5ELT3_9BACL|nr:hypothetical protein PAT3040_01603 [Paenibacillus agaridevorans]